MGIATILTWSETDYFLKLTTWPVAVGSLLLCFALLSHSRGRGVSLEAGRADLLNLRLLVCDLKFWNVVQYSGNSAHKQLGGSKEIYMVTNIYKKNCSKYTSRLTIKYVTEKPYILLHLKKSNLKKSDEFENFCYICCCKQL